MHLMITSTITRDGRTICFHTTGRSDADRCDVFLHPAPGSGEFDPDPEQTARRDVLLIGVDRPGYGGSDPYRSGESPTIAAAADDIATVLGHLGIATAGVAGWSTGGWIALALAARRPDLVDRLVLLGTPAPDDETPLGFEPADVHAKTLLLYGNADPLVRPAHAGWWKNRLTDSRIEMMPGAGPVFVVPGWTRVLSHLTPGRSATTGRRYRKS
jgi:pimeloyl-ACP methyl ester carboxylesterase